MQQAFDYIILGAGLSGLTTAVRMSKDPYFSDKSIAIIDQNLDKGNDRTWCFWETKPDLYEEIVSYKWPKIVVKGNGLTSPITIAPYQYKKIESSDLYKYTKDILSKHSNITFIEDFITGIEESSASVVIKGKSQNYTAAYVLNSIYQAELLEEQKQRVVLQQHFIGWFVKTNSPVFDAQVATYMDFSIPQKGNCRFMYVLPTSQKEALLEYTLFSEDLLPKSEYEQAIKDYLKTLGVSQYEITATEGGSIPMTTYDFTQHNTDRMLHIGTAGGWTKASTGYTFKHTLKKSKKLIDFLKSGKSFKSYSLNNIWTFYDRVLLEVLAEHNDRGAEIFTRMFKKGKADYIFRFLDEDSSLTDELKVIWSAPKWPFIKAAMRVLFKK